MRDRQEYDRLMIEWNALRRRHDANVFDVYFKDIDYGLKEENLQEIIMDVTEFFNLKLPEVYAHCETLASMVIEGDGGNGSELQYNWELLKKHGINNRDAFTLCMVHELAHLYFRGTRFMLCRNERWCHELAADYIVGCYSVLKSLATGKYKYVVRQLKATVTHPDGRHRAEVVEYARDIIYKTPGKCIESYMIGFPAFVYGRSKVLNAELEECLKSSIREKEE